MAPNVEVIHDEKLTLGEGPHWDHEAKVLYYVDIDDSIVFKYNPSTKKITRVFLDKKDKLPVGFVVPVANAKDKFVVGFGKKFALLTWDGVSEDPTNVEPLVEIDSGLETRFNDGKVDPRGRLWAGTMMRNYSPDGPQIRTGSFYSLNADGESAKTHFDGVGISNGLTWSIDHKTFYYVDTFDQSVDAFDYDISKGELKNRRKVFDAVKNNIIGGLDGMTIDTEGKLWLAVFGGSAVHRIDPETDSVLQTIKLPASKITSVAWGGPNLDELYVTSASVGSGTEGDRYPGRVFKITGLGVSGFPGVPVKL